MKKLVLSICLVAGVGAVQTVRAQAALVNLVGLGLRLGTNAALKSKLTPEQRAAQQAATDKATASQATAEQNAAGSAAPAALVMQRTPTDKLPKQAAEQITALEAQLDRCHAALLATPAGVVCTTEQRAAIQQAAVSVARAKPGWDLHPYQQEMAFYMAEDARRQQAASPASLAK